MVAPERPSVAACYIVRGGRLLMVRRRRREGALEWAGPSGNVEPGETPEQTAVREVREEIGVEIVVEERLGERIHPTTGRHLVYLVCAIVAGEPAVVADDELSAVEWCDLATVRERWAGLEGGIFPPVLEYLERVMGTAEERPGQSAFQPSRVDSDRRPAEALHHRTDTNRGAATKFETDSMSPSKE